jgi:hypothetical protein
MLRYPTRKAADLVSESYSDAEEYVEASSSIGPHSSPPPYFIDMDPKNTINITNADLDGFNDDPEWT